MPLQEVSTSVETDGKNLSNAIDLCGIWVRACARAGFNEQQSAGLLGMTPSNYTRAMSPHYPKNNPVMKAAGATPREVLREFALLLCEDLGLTVNGPDVERHALADVLAACATYVRVLSR